MKTALAPTLPLALLAGVALTVWGCRSQSSRAADAAVVSNTVAIAPTVPPAPVVPGPGPVAALPAAPGVASPAPAVAPVPVPGPASPSPSASAPTAAVVQTNAAPVPAPAAPATLRPRLRDLVQLAERGLGDSVLIAWVQDSPEPFRLSPDEIVYLTDIGISEAVLKAMIEHRGNGTVAARPAEPAPPLPAAPPVNPPVGQAPAAPGATVTATPEFEAAPQTPVQAPLTQFVEAPPATQVVVAQPPVTYSYFYSSLAPYGSWVDIGGYGLCWRPTVAVIDTGWRPYCHRGRWIYSDCGWYWHSDYSWGWAPFHYGRWWNHPGTGWVWMPDTTWSPAWVTWRYSNAYCGWAPLPPGTGYSVGVGLTYYSGSVGVSFGFGFASDYYTYIPSYRFCDRNVWHHRVPPPHAARIHNQTTVINNINHNSNNVIINEGVGRDQIAAVTRSEIRKVALRDQPTENLQTIKPERFQNNGSELAVYRPINRPLPGPDGQTAAAPGGRQEVSKPGGTPLPGEGQALAPGKPPGVSRSLPGTASVPSSSGAPGIVSGRSAGGSVGPAGTRPSISTPSARLADGPTPAPSTGSGVPIHTRPDSGQRPSAAPGIAAGAAAAPITAAPSGGTLTGKSAVESRTPQPAAPESNASVPPSVGRQSFSSPSVTANRPQTATTPPASARSVPGRVSREGVPPAGATSTKPMENRPATLPAPGQVAPATAPGYGSARPQPATPVPSRSVTPPVRSGQYAQPPAATVPTPSPVTSAPQPIAPQLMNQRPQTAVPRNYNYNSPTPSTPAPSYRSTTPQTVTPRQELSKPGPAMQPQAPAYSAPAAPNYRSGGAVSPDMRSQPNLPRSIQSAPSPGPAVTPAPARPAPGPSFPAARPAPAAQPRSIPNAGMDPGRAMPRSTPQAVPSQPFPQSPGNRVPPGPRQ